jgi:hypothetical protein
MTSVPASVRSIASDRELTVFWEPPALNSASIAGYDVIDAAGNLVCQVPSGVLSCSVPDRRNGVYDLRVIAVSNTGYRATSEPVSVIIGPPEAISAPRAVKRGDKLKISWGLPDVNSSTLMNFTVRDLSGKVVCRVPARQVNSARVSCTVPVSKLAGKTNAFRVVAESSLGRTDPSPPSNKIRV